MERDRDALLEQYAGMVPEGLDRYTPEGHHQAYKELRLKWFVYPDGRTEADGVLNLDGGPKLCTRESTRLQGRIPGSKLVRFQESGHCPFWEEPEKFNREVADFVG